MSDAPHQSLRKRLLAQGLNPSAVDAFVAENAALDALLDAGVCPRCKQPMSRTRDPRQAGVGAKVAGTGAEWYNYRCAACSYFVDRAEAAKT